MAAPASVRSEQSAALHRMLDLNRGPANERTWQDPWKVLVYDAYCRDIISPLLKVGDLRKLGITLHLLLDSEREVISDVPAIYFVQPTRANVKRLGEDCTRALYESFHVNFTPAIPRPLLEEFANATLESESVGQVSRVVDQYLNFASIEEDFFSLLLPSSYLKLNDPASADTLVESTVDAIVTGLFSVVVTMGSIPILRYSTSGAAQMVAERLGRRLHDQLKAHPALFSDGQSSGFQRPLLVICERSLDFSVLVQHAWSYCALCHDLLDLRLNRISLLETPAEGGPPKPKTYDLHAGDTFWADHLGSAFQTVASDVDRDLTEYRAAMEAINTGAAAAGGGPAEAGAAAGGAKSDAALADTTRALASTINALPELQEKKRLIDAHMNIATELLSQIKARSIDSFYAVEEALMASTSLSKDDKATLPQLLAEGGTAEDRLRLFLLLTLHPGVLEKAELDKAEAALREAGCDLRPHAFLQRMASLTSALSDAAKAAAAAGGAACAPAATSAGGRVLSNVMRLADQVGVGDNARWVGSALAAGVKQLMTSKRETPVTRAVKALMDNAGKPGGADEAFGYLDPKFGPSPATSSADASRGRSAYGQALVFVVGPGNYLEYQSLRQSANAEGGGAAGGGGGGGLGGLGGRRVTYGCTEVVTPREFVTQIAKLG